MNKTIAIIGGTQYQTFQKIGKKNGCDVLFHDGKAVSPIKKELRNMIRKADCVVILLGACSHSSMGVAKEMANKFGKQICYQEGRGATGAIQTALQHLSAA
ncbi:DUF2325 domain-containing protein [Desertibacillus haloalkaliphilus]|uniref:DUF2325 domain-containing protein n=1 Tax=Desertibacillus haloalkaliphilus TaxID=1328930 RepID=UPI001C27FC1A|nr:DUF2325 domain-containing protein [Desertibacillus haloalkaliphilus]MBU8908114.1 DUF2325 domain-containing protein [Desertibacillus haloalkaliphilus]